MLEIVAHEVGLDVEDELPCETLRPRQHQFGLVGFGRRNLEDFSVDFVHGEEGGRHTAARLHELPAVQAKLFPVRVRQLIDARFDLLLGRALRWRQVLAVDTIWVGIGVAADAASAPAHKALFTFTEPTTILVSLFVMVIDQLPVVTEDATPRMFAMDR